MKGKISVNFLPQMRENRRTRTGDMDDASFLPAVEQDTIIAPILLMGVTQEYLTFYCAMTCGIPSVIMLKVKTECELIYRCLDEIEPLAQNEANSVGFSHPAISRFARSFGEHSSGDIISFWPLIVHQYDGRSGVAYCCGWITAFCFRAQ